MRICESKSWNSFWYILLGGTLWFVGLACIDRMRGGDGTPSGSWSKVAPSLSRIEVPGGWLYKSHTDGSIAFVPATEAPR